MNVHVLMPNTGGGGWMRGDVRRIKRAMAYMKRSTLVNLSSNSTISGGVGEEKDGGEASANSSESPRFEITAAVMKQFESVCIISKKSTHNKILFFCV